MITPLHKHCHNELSLYEPIANNITYKPFGPLASMSLGNGAATTLTYDQDYRLTQKSTPTIYDVTFAYDAANNITSTKLSLIKEAIH